MQTAHITLLLGGDEGQTIQKYDVTASEIEVLRRIHGGDAVRDVTYSGEIVRSNRQELERLHRVYGVVQPDGASFSQHVAALFPGAAARVFDKLTELELDEHFVNRLAPAGEAPAVKRSFEVADDSIPLSKMNKTQLLQIAKERGIDVSADDTKTALVGMIEAAIAVPAEEEDDGIGEMPDSNMFE